MVTDELRHIAEAVAQWVDNVPGISAVYVFGSRVRGDHKPDSDVDLRLFLEEMGSDNETTLWWTLQNDCDFAELKAALPGPLGLHRYADDAADDAIRKGAANPVLVVGKAICVFTPPKP